VALQFISTEVPSSQPGDNKALLISLPDANAICPLQTKQLGIQNSGETFYSALSSFEKPPSTPVSPVSKFGILNAVIRRINLRQN